MSKPVLLLDVDGVLADFITATLTILNRKTGASYVHDDVHTWELHDSFPEHKHLRDEIYTELKSEGGCYGIPPYEGAKRVVDWLKTFTSLVVVTSPFYGSRTWVHEREKWLEDYFGISHKDIIHTGRKELIEGDAFVDDKIEHVEAWAKAHPYGHAILWGQRYNEKGAHEGNPHIIRVKGWDELIRSIAVLTLR